MSVRSIPFEYMGGAIAPATFTTQNFTEKIKKISFCININKNAKEKLSLGQKIKTDIAGANFPNSRCN